ncbi:MSHA biogenesis protein MshK [Enterovibrio nigricans]|uniref:MSHA biogenesis protein MshK n=1 Tax=Enterovibrio nigricans DSM 22720 TaxID=1121868 RepID=A0A1T4TVU0_9GAMM|nr:MSHA biogenesis protein MshK [Enterovibrio nigricans]PKF50810.1 MSHA biogenesis protein MshK [Enterovibrio nigricans]SKA44582.1 MSHA biogenesis protein MshK [Enterovibrio nigricans DSM 22720]
MKDVSKRVCALVVSLMPVLCFAAVDPTAPLGYRAPAFVQTQTAIRLPQLDAILCMSEQHCSAVLDGESVRQGQIVKGFAVSAISKNRVLLKRGNKRWSLTIFNEQVVQ